jgi:murein L,D-transpeptidase YcbB/YkuD
MMTETLQRELDLKGRELDLRESELDLRERELDLAGGRARAERWRNPLTVAVAAAALAGFINAYIADADNRTQLALENTNNQAQLALETSKAESARILEVLKIGEPDRVRENLNFLLQLGLIQSEPLTRTLRAWNANPDRAPFYLSPAVVAAFQRQAGMDDDGIAGPATQQRMRAAQEAGRPPSARNGYPN